MLPLSYLLPLPDKCTRVGFRTLKIYITGLLKRLSASTERPHCIQPSLIFQVSYNSKVYTQIFRYYPILTPSNVVRFKKLTVAQLHNNIPPLGITKFPYYFYQSPTPLHILSKMNPAPRTFSLF